MIAQAQLELINMISKIINEIFWTHWFDVCKLISNEYMILVCLQSVWHVSARLTLLTIKISSAFWSQLWDVWSCYISREEVLRNGNEIWMFTFKGVNIQINPRSWSESEGWKRMKKMRDHKNCATFGHVHAQVCVWGSCLGHKRAIL